MLHYTVNRVEDSKSISKVVESFEDYNFYQTFEFASLSQGGEKIEQFLLFENDELIAASLVRLKIIPKLNRGIAFLRWGPIFRQKDSELNLEIFQNAIQFLHEEYVVKRRLVLRIFSREMDSDKFKSVINKFGFQKIGDAYQTILIDLQNDEEQIRSSFRKKWRYSLRQAEKKNLIVKYSTDQNYFDEFIKIYNELLNRKGFKETIDVNSFYETNNLLPTDKKLKVFLCFKNDTPIAGKVITDIGKTGIYLLGGSTDEGLKNNASYLIQWEVIKYLKSKNLKYYDLGGIDKENNPGVYTFKTGMGGEIVNYLSNVEASKDLLSKKIVQLGELIKR